MNKSDQFLMCLKYGEIKLDTALAVICGYLAWQNIEYSHQLKVDGNIWKINFTKEKSDE